MSPIMVHNLLRLFYDHIKGTPSGNIQVCEAFDRQITYTYIRCILFNVEQADQVPKAIFLYYKNQLKRFNQIYRRTMKRALAEERFNGYVIHGEHRFIWRVGQLVHPE